ncbi:hypothetical protein I6N95_01870 [Vagococcus sp. BWB3-3]|uniref:Uncharacterized protein n=1 Tax=Vagococcus allomyrinae TaxID=2794353 RepID=A0A940SQI4_9ENTE|nr:hypothetical protein [Vagococcus allomyrinae]MBP1039747.1 hypothetical protein [Vagococcus allomyrinae]
MVQLVRSFNYFIYLKIMLLVIPSLYLIYALLSAAKANLSMMTYIVTQPVATIMLLVSCLSLFWFLLYQRHYDQRGQGKDLRKSLFFYLVASAIVGNLVGAGLAGLAIRQMPKPLEKTGIKEFWFEGILLLITLFCSFALIRMSLSVL